MEDGTFLRVGLDQAYTPKLADYTMLNARLIGFSAKFYTWTGKSGGPQYVPGELGIITDTTSCEEGVFTAPNPFTTMSLDLAVVPASMTQT